MFRPLGDCLELTFAIFLALIAFPFAVLAWSAARRRGFSLETLLIISPPALLAGLLFAISATLGLRWFYG
jgi:hypothetical protein